MFLNFETLKFKMESEDRRNVKEDFFNRFECDSNVCGGSIFFRDTASAAPVVLADRCVASGAWRENLDRLHSLDRPRGRVRQGYYSVIGQLL